MASFANLVASLNLNIQNFSTNMRRASTMTNRFAANLRGQINNGLILPARRAGVEFKDVARIVQGILISKAFYSGLNAIRNCTNAVWEFSQELEYAKIAYSNLFGDVALAEEFINVLKDFGATTPFTFTESEAAAKRLLAYGIQYKNVMYIMQGILAASSMQGDPQVIESVSRALGQIYTKGRLMNEEMRQLAEAGIPAYEILRDELGLTQEQLQSLGDQAIPASIAINALIEGMTKRYGSVIDASSKTLRGIISNIKDNATMIASGIFEPVFIRIKSMLNVLGQFLFRLREIYELRGLGGVFEAIFPPEMHATLRQFIANFAEMFQAVSRLGYALSGLLRPILEALIRVYNAFGPILITVINALAAVVQMVTENATAMKWLTAMLAAAATMWVLFKVRALASMVVVGVVTLISKALAGLSAVLTFVTAHPFWALLIGLGGLVVGLSGGFGKLSDAISGFFKKITQFNGIDPDKILLPSQKERANDLNKFNKELDSTADSMDELADSTGKATKAAKGLLSFDEVFKLNEPDEGTDKGIDVDTDFEVPDLSDLDTGTFIPEVPSFEGFATNYVGELIKSLKDKLIGAGLGAVIGGALGGALGGVLGGPLGAKIGAVAGAIAGWFWDDVAKFLGLTDVGKVALPIATGLGAIIGGLAGGPAGAAIGAGIGALIGWLIDAITRGISEGDWTQVGYPLGIGLGAGIGFLAGGPGGAAIGAAIGGLVAWIYDSIVTGITTGEWDFTGLGIGIGTGVGAAIGGIIAGPPGAIIGAAVGALVGWIGSLIAENWEPIKQWFSDAFVSISTGAAEAATEVSNWLLDTGLALSDWASATGSNVSNWATNTASTIGTWVSNTTSSIGSWVSTNVNRVSTWAANTGSTIGSWAANSTSTIGTFVTDSVSSFGQFVSNTSASVSNWASNLVSSASNAMFNFVNSIVSGLNSAISNISTFCSTALSQISGWASSFANWISNTLSNAASAVSNFISSIGSTVTGAVSNAVSGAVSRARNFFSGGHATGGIFNREHIARFAEGNKAEAVIPLENASAMQPFVDAVANGLTQTLAPLLSTVNVNGGQSQLQLQPLYVGTLIADDRSLRELQRKMRVIQLQEEARRGE